MQLRCLLTATLHNLKTVLTPRQWAISHRFLQECSLRVWGAFVVVGVRRNFAVDAATAAVPTTCGNILVLITTTLPAWIFYHHTCDHTISCIGCPHICVHGRKNSVSSFVAVVLADMVGPKKVVSCY
mmetsp:Transcript_10220/g.21522  ORF Transcript_10220/g.21522 Transcript_10220/m.21522 type:complete len:127 (-) Transcript_10220:175-555(-)